MWYHSSMLRPALLLSFLFLTSCTLATEALKSTGFIPIPDAVIEAAKAVDAAGWGWVEALLGIGGVVVAAKTGQVVAKRRKAKKDKKEKAAP